MLIADAKDPKDANATGAEGRTPCLNQDQDMLFMLYNVFLLFLPFMLYVYEISTGRKTNKPRGRAFAVSTISTCFSLCYYLLPTPPPISVRKDGGITVVYLCGF